MSVHLHLTNRPNGNPIYQYTGTLFNQASREVSQVGTMFISDIDYVEDDHHRAIFALTLTEKKGIPETQEVEICQPKINAIKNENAITYDKNVNSSSCHVSIGFVPDLMSLVIDVITGKGISENDFQRLATAKLYHKDFDLKVSTFSLLIMNWVGVCLLLGINPRGSQENVSCLSQDSKDQLITLQQSLQQKILRPGFNV